MIEVLRLGHRIRRDKRITTHCALTSRAFGASKMFYSGEKDSSIENSVSDVVKRWGGKFSVEYVKKWEDVMKGKKIVHLTMYGMPVEEKMPEIKNHKNVLFVIGGEKVPPELYELADFNVSVGLQPHSEVAALAITLDRYYAGKELQKKFKNGLKIMPKEKGKKVI